MRTLLQDLRYGLRMLARNPGFTAVAVLTLALGIGVNATLFTAFDAVALKPLPVREPNGVVRFDRGGFTRIVPVPPACAVWRCPAQSLAGSRCPAPTC